MAASSLVLSLIDYYTNLLIIQYSNKPKAAANMAAVVKQIIANGILFDIRDGYDVDTAVGAQLDIIGKYVGVDRFYQSQDINGVFFGYSDQFENEPANVTGYADTTDFLTKAGEFLSISDLIGNGFILNDSDFRVLIKLKILINTSNFSDKNIDDNLYSVFGNSLYAVDDYNMSMYYFALEDMSLIIKVARSKNLLPTPMGVGIKYLIENKIYFGFSDSEESYASDITGYASTSDFDTKEGTYFGIDNIIT